MEVSMFQQPSLFWCHYCQLNFTSQLKPGKDHILCPQCNNDFCQITTKTNHPELFKPFQKQPQKKQKFMKKIEKHSTNMTANELAQIIELRQSQNFQITEQMLQKKRKTIKNKSECSVCSTQLKSGQKAIIPTCGHTFHQQCLIDWVRRKNNCPTCRQKIFQEAQQNSFF